MGELTRGVPRGRPGDLTTTEWAMSKSPSYNAVVGHNKTESRAAALGSVGESSGVRAVERGAGIGGVDVKLRQPLWGLLLADELHLIAHLLGGCAVFPADARDLDVIGVDDRERGGVHVLVLLGVEIRASGEVELQLVGG